MTDKPDIPWYDKSNGDIYQRIVKLYELSLYPESADLSQDKVDKLIEDLLQAYDTLKQTNQDNLAQWAATQDELMEAHALLAELQKTDLANHG